MGSVRTAISLSLGGLPTCTTAPLVGSPMDIPLGMKPVYPVQPPIVRIAGQHDAPSTVLRTPGPGALDDTVAVRLMSLRITCAGRWARPTNNPRRPQFAHWSMCISTPRRHSLPLARSCVRPSCEPAEGGRGGRGAAPGMPRSYL